MKNHITSILSAITLSIIAMPAISQAQMMTPGVTPASPPTPGPGSSVTTIPLYYYGIIYDDSNGATGIYSQIYFLDGSAALLDVPTDPIYWDTAVTNGINNAGGWGFHLRPSSLNPIQWDGFALEFEVPPMLLVPYFPNYDIPQMNAIHYPDFGINQPNGTPLSSAVASYYTNFDFNGSGEFYYVFFQNPELIIDHDKKTVRIVTAEGLVVLEQEYQSEDNNSIEFLNVWLNLEDGSGFINERMVELPETLENAGEADYVPVTFDTQHNL